VKESVIVCRCEDVTVKAVEEAVEQGAHTPNDVKRLTRCGSGICQAKSCSDAMVEIIHKKTGLSQGEIGIHRPRIPLRPLPLKTLVSEGHFDEKL
jgi:bacterioferritin-associated ferredoxin